MLLLYEFSQYDHVDSERASTEGLDPKRGQVYFHNYRSESLIMQ